ncbi:uncharacterized protein Z518_06612 [Rhinocladiella mackenziei CBS 650.93]|uniref:Rhinocladiella mackenziei CBS 650.93 unplaced genomic scaffold supercont1.5, whole genome shotgun sequence n=1 Tax=Rhinocladiella mackenziei CBS 650.93 TaxID=1442369 RepID=A0A0D2FM78_9EURO|nr:uncharacterized protein Z518_06612 [Rhinocladiella mackenziei CBS 650.93]KIX03062.1 hypothetical protein Z518_06612 [Rhinocladiella mackenziei CBS 650.93]
MQPPFPAPVAEWHNNTYDAINPTRPEMSQASRTIVITAHVPDIVDTPAVDKAAQKIGSWDVIIASAGYIPNLAPIDNSDADEWRKTFEINVKGSYVLTRAFLPYKKAGGTIIASLSGFAFFPPSLPILSGSGSTFGRRNLDH